MFVSLSMSPIVAIFAPDCIETVSLCYLTICLSVYGPLIFRIFFFRNKMGLICLPDMFDALFI